MAAKYFRFTKQGSTGQQTIDCGEAIVGKALILWTTRQTSLATTDGAHLCIGMADSGGRQVCRSVVHPDNEGTPTAGQIETDDVIVRMGSANAGTGPTIDLQATFVGWTSTGFTLDWTINDADATIFHALILGGAEIDAYLKLVRPSTGSASTVVTDIPFRPSAFVVLGGAGGEDGGNPDNDSASEFGSMHGLGWSDGAAVQACVWTLGRPGLTAGADTYRGLLTNGCASIRVANLLGAGVMGTYQVTTVTSTGFTLTRTSGSREHNQHVLCLKNVRLAAGSFSAPTSNGDVSLSVGFQAECVIAQSHNASSTNTSGMHLCLGAWDGVDQGFATIAGVDSSDPSEYARSGGADQLLSLITAAAVGATSAVNASCAVSAVGASSVTLTFGVTSPTGTRDVIWVALRTQETDVTPDEAPRFPPSVIVDDPLKPLQPWDPQCAGSGAVTLPLHAPVRESWCGN